MREIIRQNLKLIKNFSSLSILQISNYIFPLITFPYLVRVLGVEKYGLANFAFAFSHYFITLTDYGFNLSATKEISIFRNNHKQISSIFGTTIVIKFILFIISLFIFAIVVFSFNRFSNDHLIYFVTLFGVLGHVFFPVWFLQGMERMEIITALTIIFRIISVLLIFLLVNSETDLLNYVIINSGYFLVLGLVSFGFVTYYFKLNFTLPNRYQLFRQLKKGWHIFLSTISINLYTTSNTFLLGLLAGNESVGYFSAANKLKEAAGGLIGNMGRTVYPHLSKLFSQSKEKALDFISGYRKIIIIFSSIISVTLLIFAEPIISIIIGDSYLNSVSVLRILAFLPLIIVLSNLYGIQVMLNLGYSKKFNKIITLAAILNFAAMFIFVPFLSENGAALSMLVTEIFVTSAMYYFVKSRKLLNRNEI